MYGALFHSESMGKKVMNPAHSLLDESQVKLMSYIPFSSENMLQ